MRDFKTFEDNSLHDNKVLLDDRNNIVQNRIGQSASKQLETGFKCPVWFHLSR